MIDIHNTYIFVFFFWEILTTKDSSSSQVSEDENPLYPLNGLFFPSPTLEFLIDLTLNFQT